MHFFCLFGNYYWNRSVVDILALGTLNSKLGYCFIVEFLD